MTWTPQTGAASVGGGSSSIAYDSATKGILAWVNAPEDAHQGLALAAYTMTWDGSTWTDRSSNKQPSGETDSLIVYDVASNQVVVFGGSRSSADPYSETWTWDGTSWTQRT